jgi:hypothetical protein
LHRQRDRVWLPPFAAATCSAGRRLYIVSLLWRRSCLRGRIGGRLPGKCGTSVLRSFVRLRRSHGHFVRRRRTSLGGLRAPRGPGARRSARRLRGLQRPLTNRRWVQMDCADHARPVTSPTPNNVCDRPCPGKEHRHRDQRAVGWRSRRLRSPTSRANLARAPHRSSLVLSRPNSVTISRCVGNRMRRVVCRKPWHHAPRRETELHATSILLLHDARLRTQMKLRLVENHPTSRPATSTIQRSCNLESKRRHDRAARRLPGSCARGRGVEHPYVAMKIRRSVDLTYPRRSSCRGFG